MMAVCRLWILCGVVLLATKDGSGLIIGGCEQGSVDVVEDSDISFTCDAYLNNRQWVVYNERMQTIFSGSCISWNCEPWNDTFYLYNSYYDLQNKYYRNTFRIYDITRNSARAFSCNDSSTYARCDLRIIVQPVFRDCSVSISYWMVTGSCTVTGMYSSDNNYTCKWSENENKEEFGGFPTNLTSYRSNSRIYMKGVCSFAKPMPLNKGVYLYSVRTVPGADDYFEKKMYIDAPYQVQLNHNCPEYVFEGSTVRCACNASRTVSPPALLVWEGMKNATLLLTNVSRRLNQQQFICRLQWGPDGSVKENTSYKLTVAYGPLDVQITIYENKTEDESERTSVTCTATDVYPSAVFQWNVTCYNQTDSGDSSTCFLNSTQKFESLAILCTASNIYYSQLYASHVCILSSLGNQEARTAGPNAGLIGGVIAAVIVVLIIVAVLIVYIIKRRKGILDSDRGFWGIFSGVHKHFHHGRAMAQPYGVVHKPQIQPQTPIKRQAGPLGDMYTVTNTTCSGHVVDDYAVVCRTANNNTGGAESPDTHQTTQMTQSIRESTTALKPISTTKPNIRDLPGTVYMNVTEVPTDSGLGVYHEVPWATMSGSTEPETSEYSVPTICEDEYNELHFEEDRTGQEDQADNYHHLQIT